MNLLQNENAKTNRRQNLCQEIDGLLASIGRLPRRIETQKQAAINLVDLVLFYSFAVS